MSRLWAILGGIGAALLFVANVFRKGKKEGREDIQQELDLHSADLSKRVADAHINKDTDPDKLADRISRL